MSIRTTSPQRVFLLTLLVAFAATLGACGDRGREPQFKATDITGAAIGGDFALTDHTGKARRLSDFKDKVVVVFFGFMQCADVCPTTLSEVAAAMKELGPKAKDVQVLFVTVDPERDTQELLAQYVPAFDPSFLGLRGSHAELESTAKLFKVFYQKTPSARGGYTMDHTAGCFVFDKQGRIRLLVPYGAGPAVFAHDLSQLLG